MPSEASPLGFADIVLVPFPFTDQTAAKRRPAVVISAEPYNSHYPDAILMPVTSQLHANVRPGDAVIEDWQEAGLLKPSAVKPVIATLEQSLVIRRLGALTERDRETLSAALGAIFGKT